MDAAERKHLGRRTLLRATAVIPAAGTVAVASGTTPGYAGTPKPDGHHYDSASPRFSLAILPDTQYLFDADSSDPEPLRATFRYLVSQREDANIAFMAHLGDVTEHGSREEISLAATVFGTIHGKVPYSVLAGNHDIDSGTDDQRGDSAYLDAFGPRRFSSMPTFGGASADGYNSYHVLRAGGREWLVLALDWRVSASGLEWARKVLDAHPTLPAILTTHDLAWADDDGAAQLSDNGRRLWDGLIRGNDQIFLALSGHYWPPGRTILTNDAVKLPDPFEGDHAWMGILSWEGRNGDAGKTTGWSPDEPTCSLDVTPERFLQFVVYPQVQDADPTSWSHALPVGRWTHVAVVNDGHHTVVYVDGSKIARNPTQPSTGIATLGKPFVIGATQFQEKFGQGFYGWIGDTRIVGRALRPKDFMTSPA
ncbi:LamG-like jellyroll fold domain-containing protein [Streptomyces javensis]|uniref:LamG-like jellyroll fold domain-containing protein n=1 Tax=Streptomyces javensis TaxID=114698 RepID=UPI0034097FC4